MLPGHRTWRVQGLPLSFKKDTLVDALCCQLGLGCGDDGNYNVDIVTIRTLAPDLQGTQVATVHFRSLPARLEDLKSGGRLPLDLQLPSGNPVTGDKRKRNSLQTTTVTIDEKFDGITVLHSPSEPHDFDILAVSGLGSHAFGSFVHKETGHMWLGDSLPRDYPTSRVMTYGYKSTLPGSTSFATLEDFASSLHLALSPILHSGTRRRILLIGHSLGGLVIKQTLIRISQSDTERDLLGLFVGCLFFGVPNDGMNVSSFQSIVGDQPNRPLVDSLHPENFSSLREQRVAFSELLHQRRSEEHSQFDLFCFYETKRSPTAARDHSGGFKMIGPLEPLVSPSSATSCLAPEDLPRRAFAIDETHSNLVKFGRSDPVYDNVVSAIGQIYTRPVTTEWRDEEKGIKPRLWVVPFEQNRNFVGRTSILRELIEKADPYADSTCTQRIAVEGLGGVGKTQLALKAAYQIHDKHPDCSVFWVPAIDATSFENAYRKIGRELKIPGIDGDQADVKRMVKDAMSHEDSGTWLLVIDNADDAMLLLDKSAPYLDQYLPSNKNGSILFTTRNHALAVRLVNSPEDTISVGEMSDSDARLLLTKGLKDDQVRDDASIVGLLEFLANLPLAIRQATAFLAKTGFTTEKYLGYCHSSNKTVIDLLSRDFEDRGRYDQVQNPVATTWLISFEHISRDNPLAAEYLKFLCLLAEKDAPAFLLPVPLGQLESDEAIAALKAYAFITQREQEKSFDIHRLVRLAMQNWLDSNKEKGKWVTQVTQRVAELFPSLTFKNRAVWMKYLPHAQSVLQFQEPMANTEAKRELLLNVGHSFDFQAKYGEAGAIYCEAFRLSKQLYGYENPKTVCCLDRLALVRSDQGDYAAAYEIHSKVFALRKTCEGCDRPNMVGSMAAFAITLHLQGKYDEAFDMQVKALQLSKKVFGDSHVITLLCASNYALSLYDRGKSREANEMQNEILSKMKELCGEKHLLTLLIMRDIAICLCRHGNFDEAEAMQRETIRLYETFLGYDDPEKPVVMAHLARTLDCKGKHDEAYALWREVIPLMETVHGHHNPETLRCMTDFTRLLRKQGRHVEYEAVNQEISKRRENDSLSKDK